MSAPVAPVHHDVPHADAVPLVMEPARQLSNFAQSFLYSSLGRPAAAITQMADSVFPNLLPHLELTPPPPSDTVGGFLGDAVGNFVDMAVLSRFNRMHSLLGSYQPMVQAGETMAVNSLLTPVNVAPGESIWLHKMTTSGSAFIAGAITRGAAGKLFPEASKIQSDYINYGVASIGSAANDAFFPLSDSPYKPLQKKPTDHI